MKTEAQKNFKRQMEQLQKELDNKVQEQVFSYIENDHIDNYYKVKKKVRKVRCISIGSVLVIILSVISLFTWLKPVFNKDKINNVQLNNMGMLESKVISNYEDSSQSPIFKYLDDMKSYEYEIIQMINFINANLNKTLKNTDKKAFISTITEYKNRINSILIAYSEIKVPLEMKAYNQNLISIHNMEIQYIDMCLNVTENYSRENIEQLNLLIKDMAVKRQYRLFLLKSVFNNAGIKYQEENSGLKYWYNK